MGDVKAKNIKVTGKIITGLRDYNPDQPDRDSFVKDLKALREQLAGLTDSSETPVTVARAVKTLDGAIEEAEEDEPMASSIRNRLEETLEFITNAGKALKVRLIF